MAALYKGFSTHNYLETGTFGVSDVELIKLDLLSHIYTRRGSRLNMPNFGTRIPDLAFEPMDQFTLSILEDDLRMVFDYDPRVELQGLVIIPDPDGNTVIASAKLLYIELNMEGDISLNIEFDNA